MIQTQNSSSNKKDENRLRRNIIFSLIYMGLGFTKIIFFGGSPFLLLITTSLFFTILNKK